MARGIKKSEDHHHTPQNINNLLLISHKIEIIIKWVELIFY